MSYLTAPWRAGGKDLRVLDSIADSPDVLRLNGTVDPPSDPRVKRSAAGKSDRTRPPPCPARLRRKLSDLHEAMEQARQGLAEHNDEVLQGDGMYRNRRTAREVSQAENQVALAWSGCTWNRR